MKILALILAVPFFASAVVKVSQVDNRRQKVVVKATKQTVVGSEWVVTVRKGMQCSLPVVEVVSKIAILDGSDCTHLRDIRAGQRLSKNLLVSAAPSMAKSSLKSSKSGLGLSDLNWDNVSAFALISTNGNINVSGRLGSGSDDGGSVLGFGAQYEWDPEMMVQDRRAFVTVGSDYEMDRSYGGGVKLAILGFTANGGVKVTDEASVFLGANYAWPLEKGDVDLAADFGYQLGASYIVEKDIAADVIYRFYNFKVKEEGLDKADMQGLVLRGRYMF